MKEIIIKIIRFIAILTVAMLIGFTVIYLFQKYKIEITNTIIQKLA